MVPDKQLERMYAKQMAHTKCTPPLHQDARAGNRGDVNRPPERPVRPQVPLILLKGMGLDAHYSIISPQEIAVSVHNCLLYVCTTAKVGTHMQVNYSGSARSYCTRSALLAQLFYSLQFSLSFSALQDDV